MAEHRAQKKPMTMCTSAFLALVSLAAVEGAAVPVDPRLPPYHSDVGIPRARRIWETELFYGTRVVGGSPAKLGDYPYLVGLVITLSTDETSVCGASMVSNTRAVTAAHCWWDGEHQARKFTMVFGSIHLFYGGTRVETSSVTLHDLYKPEILRNDLAIIKFDHVAYTDVIQSIALPSGSLLYTSFAGYSVEAAGFGQTDDWTDINEEQVQSHVTIRVISNEQCLRQLASIQNAHEVVVDSTLCTGAEEGRSICSGDSGGPLVLTSEPRPVLVGVTSFGVRWGCQRYPAGFARVTHYIDWITSFL